MKNEFTPWQRAPVTHPDDVEIADEADGFLASL